MIQKILWRIFRFAMPVLLFFTVAMPAQSGPWGAGIFLGEPTGVSIKKWTGKSTAIDAVAGWSLGRKSHFHMHADYLWHRFDKVEIEQRKLALYYGIGGVIRFGSGGKWGARFPLGVAYCLENAPLDLFAEVAPVFRILPDTELDLSAGIGLRYYFK